MAGSGRDALVRPQALRRRAVGGQRPAGRRRAGAAEALRPRAALHPRHLRRGPGDGQPRGDPPARRDQRGPPGPLETLLEKALPSVAPATPWSASTSPAAAPASGTRASSPPASTTPSWPAPSSASGSTPAPASPGSARACSGWPSHDGRRPAPRAVLAYGALGLPLAFAALPLYVHVPRLYTEAWACRWPAWVRCCSPPGRWMRCPTP
jgi:hypothetical protein